MNQKKNLLFYTLGGVEPDKETMVALRAANQLGHKTILVSDRLTEARNLAEVSYENPHWDFKVLAQAVEDHQVDHIFLMTDFAKPLVGWANDKFQLKGPSHNQFQLINEKQHWYDLATKNNILMPKQVTVCNHEELKSLDWNFPIIVKPSNSTANVSQTPYGYQFFESPKNFYDYLVSENLLDSFLELNASGTLLGKYIIQEKIPYKRWCNAHFTFIEGQPVFHEVNEAIYNSSPNEEKIYATFGPASVPEEFNTHISAVVKVLKQEVGLKNTAINFDLVLAEDGNIYTIDINPRASGSFTIASEVRDYPYWNQYIESILEGKSCFQACDRSYMRKVVDLPAGEIQSIEIPKNNDCCRVLYPQGLYPGFKIPECIHRSEVGTEILVAGQNFEICKENYIHFMKNFKIKYKGNNSTEFSLR